jgi:DNA modification methylase
MGIDEVLAGREKWTVIHGDVRDVLKTLPAAAFDFCLSDVPYGLGAREPTAAEIIAYLQGEELDTRGDFMGRRWSIPSVGVWLEVSRCLKPGAHVFSFGGTRTWDLISLGLRAAGFENRDTIAEDYPALRYDYGSGFPKSMNVSKAIDAAAGAEREVVGLGSADCEYLRRGEKCPGHGDAGQRQSGATVHVPATAPSTDAAKEWDGWGIALKPSWEPVLVFRKPLEGTVAANVLKHGCGALNIDACRVYTDWQEADRPESWKRSGHSREGYDAETIAVPPGNGIYCNPLGRFPANRVLVHAEGCVRVGRKKVASSQFNGHPEGHANEVYGKDTRPRAAFPYAPDGTETVDDWRCVDGCPVKALGEQSGESVTTPHGGDGKKLDTAGDGWGFRRMPSSLCDSGTAARFYPQFQAQEPWFYSSKASRAEREFGCEHLPARKSADVTGRDEEAAGHNNPRSGSRKRGEIRNTGPCVKPQEFLRWLVRLGCRPGGLVLVPYCGTGSEVIACVGAGMRAIGIEGDAEMVAIANARCAAWEQYPAGAKPAAGIERERLEARGQLSLLDMAG